MTDDQVQERFRSVSTLPPSRHPHPSSPLYFEVLSVPVLYFSAIIKSSGFFSAFEVDYIMAIRERILIYVYFKPGNLCEIKKNSYLCKNMDLYRSIVNKKHIAQRTTSVIMYLELKATRNLFKNNNQQSTFIRLTNKRIAKL